MLSFSINTWILFFYMSYGLRQLLLPPSKASSPHLSLVFLLHSPLPLLPESHLQLV